MMKRYIVPTTLAAMMPAAAFGQGPPQGGPQAMGLRCDDSIKNSFAPDALSKVILVKEFNKGDPLGLSETPLALAPRAGNDVCLVKLLVGPVIPVPPASARLPRASS